MDRRTLTRFRGALARHRDQLLGWLQQAPPPLVHHLAPSGNGPAPPSPDVLPAVDTALARIDDGTFGKCMLCPGDVEPERLTLDFTTRVCLDHFSPTQRRALEDDLQMAARVQQHLFPACLPALPGFDLAAHAHPAHIVGGDYYDFFFAGDRAQGMAIADVMGKGVPAAMLMANLQASLRILGPEYDDLAALATRLNTLFRYNLKLIRFLSICLLTVDVETGRLRYSNAGHNPPLVRQAATGTNCWLKPTGPAIGLMAEPTYTAAEIRLAPGDVVVLYTDGLVEARAPGAAPFGEDLLARYVADHAADPADALLSGLWQAAARHAGGTLQDDTALLVLKRTA